MSGRKTLISVIICTYNRADLLTDALHTVCQQTLEHSEYEVIVVDNNSTDQTATVSQSFVARYPHVRYCFEPQQGLSHARNRGWHEAKGEYVAYIDDDCKVPEGWLAVAKEVIEGVSPTVFGGPSFAFYNTPKPAWYKDIYGSNFPYSQAQHLERAEVLYGSNLFLRRNLFECIGDFDPKLGMSGQKIGYGEETELLHRICATMPQAVIYYEPRLWLYHLVRSEKMSWHWIISARFAQGRNCYFVYPPSNSKLIFIIVQVVKYSLLLLFSVPFGLLFRSRKQYHYFDNFLYEVICNDIETLGKLYEQSRQLILCQG
ncbi:MAG: glycosyltransferase family 2 protein [Moorea sp. SIOASIH]|nr:glycosyltransferase family 2 protein [Moorena sp. SIOASIH]